MAAPFTHTSKQGETEAAQNQSDNEIRKKMTTAEHINI